jgi:putative PIG3 family NAD(P)H quinone oxidoreductase
MTRARAVVIREPGDPSVLQIADLEVRDPGPGEVAVDVAAAGLNRADLLQRRGLYPPPPGFRPDLIGMEYAGTIGAVGPGVQTRRVGERVMGIIGGGGMATRVVVHEREAIPIPDPLTLTDAAAIPEVFLTAFDALILQARVQLGEAVLIHAVGSGVGTALLQLTNVAGAASIGTSRTANKLELARGLGLHHGFVPEGGQFAESVRNLTAGRGADVIVDCVGAAYLDENVRAIAMRGRLVLYGTLGGAAGDFPVGVLMSRRAQIYGTVLRSRPLEEKAVLAQTFAREAVPLFAAGKLKPVIHAVVSMRDVAQAHAQMEKDDTFGKIVLAWD